MSIERSDCRGFRPNCARAAGIQWADANALPPLIELADIQGDLHMHTTATDGGASLEEMAEAAYRRGLRYIAITDHSQRVSMARGLNAERLLAQWRRDR
jgi:DNA polymerase (family 10)